MTERRHYWNEDTQSWEDASDRGRQLTVTPPSSPRPTAPGGAGRRVLWSVLSSAAALVGATALVLLLTSGGASDDDGSSAAPSPSRSEGPAASGPSGATPPNGYLLVDDEEGFSTAVPSGWDRMETESPTGSFDVVYHSPDMGLFLRVLEVPEPLPERPFAEVRDEEGFEELAMPESFQEANNSGLKLKYRVGSAREAWSVVDSRFKAGDSDHHYGVALYRAGEERPMDEHLLHVALRHFCPPGTTCGEVSSPGE